MIGTRFGLGAVLTLVVMAPPARSGAQAPAAPRILVMPFDSVTRDASLFWLSEASSVLLADNLNAMGVSAIGRDERREAFDRLQVPPNVMLTDATVIRIGQLVRAGEVITGSVQMDRETLVVRARGIALETGRISHDITERGPAAGMFAIFERVARRIAPARSTSGELRVPPLPVFESYIKGLLAETPATAINYLNAALTALPTFDRARLALWEVYAEQGDHARALTAVTPVPADSE